MPQRDDKLQYVKPRFARCEWLLAVASSILVMLLAGINNLSPRDMAWRLWISSLVAGIVVFFVTMLISRLSPFRDKDINNPFKALGVVLFLLTLFSVVYGVLFRLLFLYLSLFLPLNSGIEAMAGQPPGNGSFILDLCSLYWPTILITSVSWSWIPLLRPGEAKPGDILLPMPIGTLLRAVLAIVFLVGFQAAESSTGLQIFAGAGTYVTVLLILLFFLPLETLWRKNSSRYSAYPHTHPGE